MVNRQFYTMKFSSSRLKEFDYNITTTFQKSKLRNEIIALADSQILRSIRDIRNKEIDYILLENLYSERDKLKKSKNSNKNIKKINQIQDKINEILFIPDYVTVIMENLSHYEYIYRNGIIINGKIYKRLSCSAGQARVSTVVLCCTEIIDELKERLNNGRDLSKKFSPSKFNAYFGLSGSATKLVSEPKFIVVRDFINKTKFKTNFVTETDWDIDDTIEEKEVELEMNRTDGMGLISPRQAKIWADDLGLDWIPSQFCVRQSFIKGMLCTFDIHKFCEEKNNGNYIVDTIYKDENGNYIKADLREYDVILSESQFKLWDSYKNIEQYIELCHKNKLFWGVSQYTPKKAKDTLKLNYQFIQTLNLNKNDIEKLCSQFVDWISGVSYDNVGYMLLFLLGVNNDEEKINRFLKSSDNYWLKSLIVNHELKNDKYIRSKIHSLIKTQIKNGCLGNIYVDGNFQVIVSDPYGFMQHVCGLEVTGLLKENEFYSNYWNEKNINQVDSMRSPLTYRSEHVILNLKKDENTEEWYKYCKLGIIVNYHGHECVNWGGSDFDFDILATTSNEQMIKGVYKDELTVLYDAPKPEKIIFTEDDLYCSDTFSFGSIIGAITNKSTSAYALLPIIEDRYGKYSEEYKTLNLRLQYCCKAQNAQIDKTKIGREVKGIPKIWIEKQEVKEDDTEEIIQSKIINNNILLNKYPYFFRYLYKEADKLYKNHYNVFDKICKRNFKLKINELIKLQGKSVKQTEFIDLFYKTMPLIYSKSTMNLLCRYIEDINFDIINKISIDNKSNYFYMYKNNKYNYTKEDYDKIINEISIYIKTKRKDSVIKNTIFNDGDYIDSTTEEGIKNKLLSINSNIYIVTNCLLDYFYLERTSFNKDILWNLFGDIIFENVKNNTNSKIYFPFESEDSNINYMNKKYSWREIKF